MIKTEFFENAVQLGFYGLERSALHGKKDYVRKYWEDMSIKLSVRPYIEKILSSKRKVRIADLGCGSGEGIELLTHIPVTNSFEQHAKEFILSLEDIELYRGLDISPSMIEQGRRNYAGLENTHFTQADLSKGFPLLSEEPFDLYFSSYSSLSHLQYEELAHLTDQIFRHIQGKGFVVYDLFGKYSPEWPRYWDKSCRDILEYNMTYLFSEKELQSVNVESYDCCFWSAQEFKEMITTTAKRLNKQTDMRIKDRSIFVGRHMDTGYFNGIKSHYRHQVNRLFERDFRGNLPKLRIDLQFVKDHIQGIPLSVQETLNSYQNQWNAIINLTDALLKSNTGLVKEIIKSQSPANSEELKMLTWLYRNASRFPVVDFWASIMGPQIACVLRNYELAIQKAVGCGHGLFAVVEATNQ